MAPEAERASASARALPTRAVPSTPMAERSAVERELEEIGTQLAWVRDYL